jgi:hypothetical protein
VAIELIAIGYAGVGVVLAAALAAARKVALRDCAFVVALWPLYAPIVALAAPRDAGPDPVLVALSGVADQAAARDLTARIAAARAKLAELDTLLARPEFDSAAVERRAGELAASGQAAAATAAQHRARTLARLDALRGRYRSELAEVGELIAQLAAQAELVRLDPGAPTSSSELVVELVARVEALGAVLE